MALRTTRDPSPAWPAVLLVLALAGCARRPGLLLATSPARGDAAAETRVRLVSLNTWMLPGFSEEMGARLERLPAALAAEAADVICLQEVWLPVTRQEIADALAPTCTATAQRRGGLVTFSRLPIVAQEFVPFPRAEGLPFEERLAGKGLLITVHEIPGGRLRVVNTHLALERGPNAAQLEFLRAHLATLTDLPLALAGDLNHALLVGPGASAEYGRWCALGFCHADPVADGRCGDLPAGHPAPRPMPTRVGWPPALEARGWTPDHVLVRDGAWRSLCARSYRVLFGSAAEALSDHRGLAVDLVLAP